MCTAFFLVFLADLPGPRPYVVLRLSPRDNRRPRLSQKSENEVLLIRTYNISLLFTEEDLMDERLNFP